MPPRKRAAVDPALLEDDLATGTVESDLSDYESSSDEDYMDTAEHSSSENEEDSEGGGDIGPLPVAAQWTANGRVRPHFPYTSDDGIQIQVNNKEDIVEIYENFVDQVIIDRIVEETNRYASQFIAKHGATLKTRSRVHKWEDTNADEIRTLIGLLVLQGVVHKPEHKMYFSMRESIATPFYNSIMKEIRFHLLLKFLHFVDNETFDENSPSRKLFKIKPVLDHFKNKFQSLYIPQKNISIDESLLGWKGRLGWKVYIPSKRKRFGMKMFELCESSSGYVWNFIVYTGATTEYGENYPDEPITSRIVLELSDPLLDKGYTLYLDNWYTSPDLVDKLCQRKTDCVGTMRLNKRGMPETVKAAKLRKGEIIAAFRKKQMILKWKDKKDVTLVSTTHDDKMETIDTRNGAIEKPAVVLDYNKEMGGVDLSDNYLFSYSMARSRLKKYYMKMFRHLLDICALNAFHLYKKLGGKNSRMNFLIELGENLIEKYATQELGSPLGRPSKSPKPTRLIERHFPAIIPPTNKKQKPAKRCTVCYKNGKRKESMYWCPRCDVGLCAAPCFEVYHTQRNY